jgi:hypothetical protein
MNQGVIEYLEKNRTALLNKKYNKETLKKQMTKY